MSQAYLSLVKFELISDSIEPPINLCSSEVICNLTEGLTITDFLPTCTLNCREKGDELSECDMKIMLSECDITSK